MLAAAANLHHTGLVRVFAILTAVFVSLTNFTITNTVTALLFSVFSHKSPPDVTDARTVGIDGQGFSIWELRAV